MVGGDYPWIAACMGLVGHISTYPCVWCEVEKSKLGAWRPAVLDKAGFVVLACATPTATKCCMPACALKTREDPIMQIFSGSKRESFS